MSKRDILAIVIAVAIAVSAYCLIPKESSGPIIIPADDGKIPADANNISVSDIPVLEDGFGIYGSEVLFENVYPGWVGEAPLIIINGLDRDRVFAISVRSSSKLKEGYEALPAAYLSWFTVSEPEVEIVAGGNHTIPIILSMPASSPYLGKKAEMRVCVQDLTQTGLVQVSLEARWYICTIDSY